MAVRTRELPLSTSTVLKLLGPLSSRGHVLIVTQFSELITLVTQFF